MESIFYAGSVRVKHIPITENTLDRLLAERDLIRAEYLPLLDKLRNTDDYAQSVFDYHRLLHKRLDRINEAIWCLEHAK